MDRRKFLSVAGGTVVFAGGIYYLLSDRTNFVRGDIDRHSSSKIPLSADEKRILYLASLAPSGHNTQPWFVKYIAPCHWIIGNDKTKWLPAVDPIQRETILSIGAFIQNLEYAALHHGYSCQWNLLAVTNQDENVVEVKLIKKNSNLGFDIAKIENRRTVRSNYRSEPLKQEDLHYLIAQESENLYYIPNNAKVYQWLNEQTIEANRLQMNRDDAVRELADWIRFSGKDAEKYCDGLTTAGMEMNGITSWVARNFFDKKTVMTKNFRSKGVENVENQVAHSAGWMIITSKNNATENILEAGKRMQRLFLKVRDRGIALHPMTQILEEFEESKINEITGLTDNVQFILRTGYLTKYPEPVTLRRPVDWFVRI